MCCSFVGCRVSILLHWRNNEKNQFNRLSHHPSWHVVRHTHSRPCCTHIYNTYMACTEASGTPAYGTVVSPCVPPGEWNRFIHSRAPAPRPLSGVSRHLEQGNKTQSSPKWQQDRKHEHRTQYTRYCCSYVHVYTRTPDC